MESLGPAGGQMGCSSVSMILASFVHSSEVMGRQSLPRLVQKGRLPAHSLSLALTCSLWGSSCPVQDPQTKDSGGLQSAASNEMGFSAQDPERNSILTITYMNLNETLPVEPADKTSAQTNPLISVLPDTSNRKTPPSCTAFLTS